MKSKKWFCNDISFTGESIIQDESGKLIAEVYDAKDVTLILKMKEKNDKLIINNNVVHQLEIISLYDGYAVCTCNRWYYSGTSKRTKEEITKVWKEHLK